MVVVELSLSKDSVHYCFWKFLRGKKGQHAAGLLVRMRHNDLLTHDVIRDNSAISALVRTGMRRNDVLVHDGVRENSAIAACENGDNCSMHC